MDTTLFEIGPVLRESEAAGSPQNKLQCNHCGHTSYVSLLNFHVCCVYQILENLTRDSTLLDSAKFSRGIENLLDNTQHLLCWSKQVYVSII